MPAKNTPVVEKAWKRFKSRHPRWDRPTSTPEQIFAKHVRKSDDPDKCWAWEGKTANHGYGCITIKRPRGQTIRAHRLSYELHVGPIPLGMLVLHKCDNPPCTNPRHLFIGTPKENSQDMIAKRRHFAYVHPETVARGEQCNRQKLKEADIPEIRRLREQGLAFHKIAARYGVSAQAIFHIANGRNWKHVVALLVLLSFTCRAQTTMIPWLTRSADNQRSGWNDSETQLTQNSVSKKGLSVHAIVPVCCDARGIEASPLIVPRVTVNGSLHDVMILASMSNSVRAVDAHSGADLWDVSLATPITSTPAIDSHAINSHWGALSTGVVDDSTNRFYQVFWASPDGSGNATTARYYMAVLNVADGKSVVKPVMITGSSQGYDFNQAMRKARSSAVLLKQGAVHTVLQCTGTVQETTQGASGFCFAFDTASNTVTAMTATSAGEGAGIWMAGGGLSCDQTYCYAITGNGDFDGLTQFGESFVQIQYLPATLARPPTLTILKGWSPWSDLQRSGRKQVPSGKVAGASLPSAATAPVGGSMNMSIVDAKVVGKMGANGTPLSLVYPAMPSGQWADQDWGAAGPACIFQIGICVAAGKDGIAYVIPVPGFKRTTAATVGTPANCASLASAPVWLTYDGAGNPCPTNAASLNFFPNGYTAHEHATPVQFMNPISHLWNIAAGGENNQVHVWQVSNSGVLTYLGQGNEFASSDLRGRPPGGMAGSECVGSSNGLDPDSYLLVCTMPYGDSNATITPGHTIVYDPIHITNGVMRTLWDSGDWGARNPASQWSCMQSKFLPPVIDGGEIVQPCYDGRLEILGLTQ